ncbi:MAG TPA: amidase family protein [Hyphomicrobiaceae bacterium]|nr:amidase family protein [Hyphomicrobiaceae bacterium]
MSDSRLEAGLLFRGAQVGRVGGGSIRIPASFCGLFGIKAHFARVPIFPASSAGGSGVPPAC